MRVMYKFRYGFICLTEISRYGYPENMLQQPVAYTKLVYKSILNKKRNIFIE